MKENIYSIGWDYNSLSSLPLKALFHNELTPFKVIAIVHEQTFVESVDGIPLITNKDFLALVRNASDLIHAILFSKDPFHQILWRRRAREFGFLLMDEGEIFLRAAAHFKSNGKDIDLVGLLSLPDSLEQNTLQPLLDHKGKWRDVRSNQVFDAYLNFLESGLLQPLRAIADMRQTNPVVSGSIINELVDNLDGGLALEIAPKRTDFLDKVVLLGGRKSWTFAFAAEEISLAAQGASLLKTVFSPLGISLSAAYFAGGDIQQLPHFELPRMDTPNKLVRIDSTNPIPLIQEILSESEKSAFMIQLGQSPRQLLDLITKFGIDHIALNCHRPGPRGLQAILRI